MRAKPVTGSNFWPDNPWLFWCHWVKWFNWQQCCKANPCEWHSTAVWSWVDAWWVDEQLACKQQTMWEWMATFGWIVCVTQWWHDTMPVTMLDVRNADEWDGTKMLVSGSRLIFVESQSDWFMTRVWEGSQSNRLTVLQRHNRSLAGSGTQIQNVSMHFEPAGATTKSIRSNSRAEESPQLPETSLKQRGKMNGHASAMWADDMKKSKHVMQRQWHFSLRQRLSVRRGNLRPQWRRKVREKESEGSQWVPWMARHSEPVEMQSPEISLRVIYDRTTGWTQLCCSLWGWKPDRRINLFCWTSDECWRKCSHPLAKETMKQRSAHAES